MLKKCHENIAIEANGLEDMSGVTLMTDFDNKSNEQ